MKSLLAAINKDAFEQETSVDEALVQEYFERNERKKADEKWIKEHKEKIYKGLNELGKSKADFGTYRASVSVPDNSRFDNDKVLQFVAEKGLYEEVTMRVLDEEKLVALIEDGLIDLEELKSKAWIESKGTARISVKKVERNDD
jgi:hypothetical protein